MLLLGMLPSLFFRRLSIDSVLSWIAGGMRQGMNLGLVAPAGMNRPMRGGRQQPQQNFRGTAPSSCFLPISNLLL